VPLLEIAHDNQKVTGEGSLILGIKEQRKEKMARGLGSIMKEKKSPSGRIRKPAGTGKESAKRRTVEKVWGGRIFFIHSGGKGSFRSKGALPNQNTIWLEPSTGEVRTSYEKKRKEIHLL